MYSEQGRIQDLWKGGGGAAGAKVFGGSCLKTFFGISKGGGARPLPCAPPPESASGKCVHIYLYALYIVGYRIYRLCLLPNSSSYSYRELALVKW